MVLVVEVVVVWWWWWWWGMWCVCRGEIQRTKKLLETKSGTSAKAIWR